MKTASLHLRAALVTVLIFVCFVAAWHLSTTGPSIGGASTGMTAEQIEYAKLMGKDPGAKKSTGFPPPIDVARASWAQLADPFFDNGPNDKGTASSSPTRWAAWGWVSCWPAWWRSRWVS